ncbi:MAG: polyribonucleotide nucleotidyltransferase [Candidatus Korobacteraceae bacterium]
MKQEATVNLIDGKSISFETGKLAKQAHGSVVVRMGENVVLATACANAQPRPGGGDFFPLTVDYREYTYAGGRIPGGFIKREGRPSEREILVSRQIDRPIRPLFPEAFRNDTQVIALVLSADSENDPDVAAINGASCALAVSDIPFGGPVGAVRVGLLEDKFVVNPTYSEIHESKLNLMVVGTAQAIVMIEAGAKEMQEDRMVDAIEFGHNEIKKICAVISELAQRAGKAKRPIAPVEIDEPYLSALRAKIGERLADALDTQKHPKLESYAQVDALLAELVAAIPEENAAERSKASKYFELLRERIFREQVTHEKRRPDGRAFDQIREIWIEAGVLPRTHGSAIFTRGETQALVTTTLGTGEDMQRLERFEGEAKKRFMLHYNFPPFSVAEVSFLRGAGRREIGHGALAERALLPVLPSEEEFPYAMRVVADILESNGSSSMATVCGGSLSMMDAGIPLRAPVAGVAMGLVKEGDAYAILTDIAGAEDHYGDMDFKVTGTAEGITALQMDIKIQGITPQIMREAMQQAKRGRLFILDKMNAVLSEAFYTLQIPTDKIRDLIGPGGKVIRGIVEATGVKIDVDDSGKVLVSSSDGSAATRALQMIGEITATAEVGKTYLGKVSRLADFGAFVEIFPGTDGLLHISEVAEHRIKDIRDELKEGDQVLVKVLAVEGNRIRLSRKAILKEQRAKMAPQTAGSAEGGVESEEPAAVEAAGTVTFEGGHEQADEGGDEPNFNRDGAAPSHPPQRTGAGGDADRNRRRPPRRGRRPGGGGGGGRGGPR